MNIHYVQKNMRNRTRGFTLIELLVSLFIFSVVMTISVGSLLVLIDASEKGQGVQEVIANLSFALDNMTRNIRTGTEYYCDTDGSNFDDDDWLPDHGETRDCSSGEIMVYFDGRTGDRVAFRHNSDDGIIERKVDIYDDDGDQDDQGAWLRVTAPEIFVTDFTVSVEGSTEADNFQPTAKFFLEGYIKNESNTDPDFELQTEVTQRTLDF